MEVTQRIDLKTVYINLAKYPRIKQVYFNYEKGATTAIWYDGMKTTVMCQNGEDFDEEKAIALCYMKRAFDNKGNFNNAMRKTIDSAQVISKKKKNKKSKKNWITKG